MNGLPLGFCHSKMSVGVSNQTQLTPCFDLLESLSDVLLNVSNNHTIDDLTRLGKIIDKLYKLKLKILESNTNFSRKELTPTVPTVTSFPALNNALSFYSPQAAISVKPVGHVEQKPFNQQQQLAGPANKPVKKDKQLERIKQCLVPLKTLLMKNTIQEFKVPLALCRDVHSIFMNEISQKKSENETNFKSASVKKALEECGDKSKNFARCVKQFNDNENQTDLLVLMEEIKMAAFDLMMDVQRCFPDSKGKPCMIINKFRLRQCFAKLWKLDLLCSDGSLADLRVAWLECKDVPSLINSILSLPTFQRVPNQNDLEQVREKSREVGKIFAKFNATSNDVELERVIQEIMVKVPSLMTIIQKIIS